MIEFVALPAAWLAVFVAVVKWGSRPSESNVELQKAVTLLAFTTSIVAAVLLFAGHLVIQWIREFLQQRFQFTPTDVLALTRSGFFYFASLLVILLIVEQSLVPVRGALLILLATMTAIMFTEVLPALQSGNHVQLKLGLARVKTAALLVVVLVIVAMFISHGVMGTNLT